VSTRTLARTRIDIALRLAQFYVRQARSTGDLRFLGYADAVLVPWTTGGSQVVAQALVLHATVLQSRHDFTGALLSLNRALALRPDDVQAWLTRATVLRVVGRYDESLAACQEVSRRGAESVAELCTQGVLGMTGGLPLAYERIRDLPAQGSSVPERAWRASELGEMALRLGNEQEAEHWFRRGLELAPEDFYLRGAYADFLLRASRPQEVRTLLAGSENLEPLMLRLAIAQKSLHDPALPGSRARLAAAFAAEMQRGDGVHRREQARFLLDVEEQPRAALSAALQNWETQREPEDVLILVRAAQAAEMPAAAAGALEFIRRHGTQDVRLEAVLQHGRPGSHP
jgi:Tfp pilus assembly protein PilF